MFEKGPSEILDVNVMCCAIVRANLTIEVVYNKLSFWVGLENSHKSMSKCSEESVDKYLSLNRI